MKVRDQCRRENLWRACGEAFLPHMRAECEAKEHIFQDMERRRQRRTWWYECDWRQWK